VDSLRFETARAASAACGLSSPRVTFLPQSAGETDAFRSDKRIFMNIRRTLAAVVLASVIAPVAWAAGPSAPARSVATQAATPAERAAAIRGFVLKWGDYARDVYGVDVKTWSRRLVPQFAHGDAANLREALRRETFEGAMAALDGIGHRVSDDRVLNTLAALPPGPLRETPRLVAKALGDTTQDLVYTPITPCRIVDTRNTVLGAIAANSTRSFLTAGVSSFTNQGGSATNCGMNTEAPTAVALNVTAVTPTLAGFATVYPFGTTRPDTASVNYAAGQIINNAIITPIPTPVSTFDFTIYTFGQAHYVVDIVGYFDNPRSSPVQCTNTAVTTVAIPAGGTNTATAAATCPAGYGDAGVNCESNSFDMPLVFVSGISCSAKNNGSTTASLSASRRCCRIPGR
jgi:hypothetical protein